jgi:hypothetical protein
MTPIGEGDREGSLPSTDGDLSNLGDDPLGSNVHVPDFDLKQREVAEIGEQAENERYSFVWACIQAELEQTIDEWAKKGGEGQSPLGDNWNTLPFGQPGRCKDNLFVSIAESTEVALLLNRTAKHIQSCPQTACVVFHIGGSIGYLEWLNALNLFMAYINQIRQPTDRKISFATRIASSWQPRPEQRPNFWKGAIHLGKTDNGVPIDISVLGRSASTWNTLKHRIWLIEELGLLDLYCGYIAGHNNQPPPAPQGPDISFGRAVNVNGNIMDWRVRVYFRPPHFHSPQHLSLGFSIGLRQCDVEHFTVQGVNNWSPDPRFLSKLLKNPYQWLNQQELANRRRP